MNTSQTQPQTIERSYQETLREFTEGDVSEAQYRAMTLTLLSKPACRAYDMTTDGAAVIILKNGGVDCLAVNYRDAYYYIQRHKFSNSNALELL